MKLRDIVEGKEYPKIQVRIYDINGEDELFGYCSYTNGELKSLDGDSYSLSMEVNEYGEFDDELIIVCHTRWWVGDTDEFIDTRNIECVNAIERIKEFRKNGRK